MGKKKAVPDYVCKELEVYGVEIVEIGQTSNNHGYVKFRAPHGGIAKWSWPRPGNASDPRARKNNRSQLRYYLMSLFA